MGVSSLEGWRRRWTTDTKLASMEFLRLHEPFACRENSSAIALRGGRLAAGVDAHITAGVDTGATFAPDRGSGG